MNNIDTHDTLKKKGGEKSMVNFCLEIKPEEGESEYVDGIRDYHIVYPDADQVKAYYEPNNHVLFSDGSIGTLEFIFGAGGMCGTPSPCVFLKLAASDGENVTTSVEYTYEETYETVCEVIGSDLKATVYDSNSNVVISANINKEGGEKNQLNKGVNYVFKPWYNQEITEDLTCSEQNIGGWVAAIEFAQLKSGLYWFDNTYAYTVDQNGDTETYKENEQKYYVWVN